MNDHTPIDVKESDAVLTGLDLLRAPFPENQISKLPKPTKKQTEAVKQDSKNGIRCALCGQWHHKDVVHLDYVGHAALTDRLLDCDPNWNWEPVSFDQNGAPALDQHGGMWIRLTVCGVTRLGYGDADGKTGGNAVKERIGDALRNAAMRFGAALDLWHKGELHLTDEPESPPAAEQRDTITADQFQEIQRRAEEAGVDLDVIARAGKLDRVDELPAGDFDIVMRKLQKTIDSKRPADTVDADEIPY